MRQLPSLLLLALLGLAASGCGEICNNEQVGVFPAPSGKLKAVVFHRRCGTTTEANTQVAVVPTYVDLANIPGNALIVDGDTPLQVRWQSDTELSISGLGAAQVFKQEETVTGVAIAYGK